MSQRGQLFFFVAAFTLGVICAGLVYLKLRPSEAELLLLQSNREIQKDLCSRIEADLTKFKDTPFSFRRSSLQAIFGESREAAKALVFGVPIGQALQFKEMGPWVVELCQTEARQWVKVPSAFPDQFEGEAQLVGLLPANDASNALPRQQVGKKRRLALVIGNSAYQSRPLKNPRNDAEDMSTFLKSAGFDVLELRDGDLPTMRARVDEFTRSLSGYEVGLVYYSGHGIEFAGRNYFLPVDVDIKSEEEIPRQGLDATQISEKMAKNGGKTSILIIDACRNAPVFSRFRSTTAGLKSMDAASGSIVAFSAAPGQVASDGNGRNSPYTAALLKQMQAPGKKIEDVLKESIRVVSQESGGRQVPWYNSSLTGDFYFIEQ